jgi:hypothetical protein
MASRIPSFLLDRPLPGVFKQERGKVKIPFIEEGINHLADVIKKEYVQWELSSENGFLQKIDARVKVLFLLFFVIIVSLKRSLLPELYIGFFVLFLLLSVADGYVLQGFSWVFLWFFGCISRCFQCDYKRRNHRARYKILKAFEFLDLSYPRRYWINQRGNRWGCHAHPEGDQLLVPVVLGIVYDSIP